MKTPHLTEFALDLLAARRLTRLIVKDEVSRPIRENKILHKHAKISYLLNCPICVGVYTSAAVTLSRIVFPRVSKPAVYLLAMSEAQATLTELEAQRDALSQDYGNAY